MRLTLFVSIFPFSKALAKEQGYIATWKCVQCAQKIKIQIFLKTWQCKGPSLRLKQMVVYTPKVIFSLEQTRHIAEIERDRHDTKVTNHHPSYSISLDVGHHRWCLIMFIMYYRWSLIMFISYYRWSLIMFITYYQRFLIMFITNWSSPIMSIT